MNNAVLEATLRNILHVVIPTVQDTNARKEIINQLRVLVQSIDSLRGATVEPYGSFVSDLYTKWGDLDISIELPNGLYISSAGKKLKQILLKEVHKALRNRGGSRRLLLIANARIPILKFETSFNISCDISVNNLTAQMKSKILFWIGAIDKRFHDMILLVKEWAKAHHINDPKSGSFNSYSLSLLVIFHLQTCVPPILPPLKEIYPGNMADDLTGIRVNAEKQIEEACEGNINRYKNDKSRRINRSMLAEIFTSFIEKFCDISSRASTQGISTHNGQWEEIHTNMRWLPQTYALLIEDPFEQPANSARTVSERHLQNVSEAFQTTFNVLTSPHLEQLSLVSALVSPQVSDILNGRQFGFRNYNNGTQAHYQPPLYNNRPQAYYQPPLLFAPPVLVQQNQYMAYDRRPNETNGRAYDRRPNGTNGTTNDRRPNRNHGTSNDRRRPKRNTGTATDMQPPNRNTGTNGPVQAQPNKSQRTWRPRSDA